MANFGDIPEDLYFEILQHGSYRTFRNFCLTNTRAQKYCGRPEIINKVLDLSFFKLDEDLEDLDNLTPEELGLFVSALADYVSVTPPGPPGNYRVRYHPSKCVSYIYITNPLYIKARSDVEAAFKFVLHLDEFRVIYRGLNLGKVISKVYTKVDGSETLRQFLDMFVNYIMKHYLKETELTIF